MIHVAIIEDNLQYRTTISIILQLDENIRLLHKGGNCEEVIPLFETVLPDVVLMDIQMPVMNGLKLAEEFCNRRPSLSSTTR